MRIAVALMLALVMSASVGVGSAGATDPVSGDPVVEAAGDIACSPFDGRFNSTCGMRATSDLILGDSAVDNVLALGDLQYECGSYSDFLASYDPSWGRVAAMTWPALGNHEYQRGNDPFGHACPGQGLGYFQYWGSRVAGPTGNGYYSWDLGSWHLIALNSECSFVPCDVTSAQTTWLKNDLDNTSAQCTLAYWHRPRFTGKKNGPIGRTGPFWDLLYSHNAELVLNGHKHAYARFAPLTPAGVIDTTNGVRQFISGTGGKSRGLVPSTFAMVEKVDPARRYGVLRLVLHPTSYDYEFIATDGTIVDSGTTACH